MWSLTGYVLAITHTNPQQLRLSAHGLRKTKPAELPVQMGEILWRPHLLPEELLAVDGSWGMMEDYSSLSTWQLVVPVHGLIPMQ